MTQLTIPLFTLLATLLPLTTAHGNITSPPARLPGPAMVQACGQDAVDSVLADGTLPIESVANPLPSCNLFLCRGALFDDNASLLQTFTLGQTVDMTAILPIPHEGPANISIVDTQTNEILGEPLLVFDTYADERLAELPANNTAFSVTLPAEGSVEGDEVVEKCQEGGRCVLQWFWFGTGAQQTYESCVDFVIGDGGNATAPAVNGTVVRRW